MWNKPCLGITMFHLSCHQAGKEGLWEHRLLQNDEADQGKHRTSIFQTALAKIDKRDPRYSENCLQSSFSLFVQRSCLLQHLTLNEYLILFPMHLNYVSTRPHTTVGYSHFLNSSRLETDDGISLLKIRGAQGHALAIWFWMLLGRDEEIWRVRRIFWGKEL